MYATETDADSGQTIEIDDPDAGQVGFAYAGEGQANRTEVGGATLHRSALGVTTIVPESQPAASAHYTRLPTGEVLERRHATDGARYYLVDGLGSTVALTDGAGLVTNRYSYDPYGAVTEEGDLAGAVDQPWRFAGAHHDPHGDHKIGHRYKQPDLGRWTQPDPARDRLNPAQPPEVSPYAYTGCDPVNHTDPTGLVADPVGCAIAFAGAAAFLAMAIAFAPVGASAVVVGAYVGGSTLSAIIAGLGVGWSCLRHVGQP